MAMRIRVFTKAAIFQERKVEHIHRGFRIEDERPTPVNGLCSFVAVKDDPIPESFDWLVPRRLRVIEGD